MECFNNDEWQMVGEMVNILQPINKVCTELSGES
jgi:hypothetical protein